LKAAKTTADSNDRVDRRIRRVNKFGETVINPFLDSIGRPKYIRRESILESIPVNGGSIRDVRGLITACMRNPDITGYVCDTSRTAKNPRFVRVEDGDVGADNNNG